MTSVSNIENIEDQFYGATPEEEELMELIAKSVRNGMRVHIPGIVTAVDTSTPTPSLSVQPSIQDRYLNGETARVQEIHNVPVGYLSGNGFSILYDIAVGDQVFLEFTDRSIAEWKVSGRNNIEARSRSRWGLAHAVAIPMVSTYHQERTIDADSATLGYDTVKIKIGKDGEVDIIANRINLGSETSNQALALAAQVENNLGNIDNVLTALITWYNSNIGQTATNIPAVGPVITIPFVSSGVSSTKAFTDE